MEGIINLKPAYSGTHHPIINQSVGGEAPRTSSAGRGETSLIGLTGALGVSHGICRVRTMGHPDQGGY
ncbi:hypothetical protein CEB3_c06970 [Peptococcaceae bacterium CEB3]|nr:hypothetical protein CEB3_c06970 [Peptococcaceae bacterium CEB3]